MRSGAPGAADTTRVGWPSCSVTAHCAKEQQIRLSRGQVPQLAQDSGRGLVADHQPTALQVTGRGSSHGQALPAASRPGAVRGPQRAGDRELGSSIRVRHRPITCIPGAAACQGAWSVLFTAGLRRPQPGRPGGWAASALWPWPRGRAGAGRAQGAQAPARRPGARRVDLPAG